MPETTIPATGVAHLAHSELEAAILAQDARMLPGWALFPVRGKIPPAGSHGRKLPLTSPPKGLFWPPSTSTTAGRCTAASAALRGR
jgi:hypothetical protein